MAYSGTRNFTNIDVIQLVEDAFRCVGKIPSVLVTDDYISANFSLNLLLSGWLNRGLNLWGVSRNNLLPLNPGQIEYQLPVDTVDMLEVYTRTSDRALGGTAAASSGVAANAFDGVDTTSCVQTAPNGWISYDYGVGVTQSIQMFGLTSFVNNTYTLNVQYSNDNTSWTTFLAIPATTFVAGAVQWFFYTNPPTARYYRIIETGGATLNINEIYFQINVIDLMVCPTSRSDYSSNTNKYAQGRPSLFVFNKELSPSITFWNAPTSYYNVVLYNASLQLQDIGSLVNTPAVPTAFYLTLRDGLAYELSIKVKPELSEMLERKYQESFQRAATENTEKNVGFEFDFSMDRYT